MKLKDIYGSNVAGRGPIMPAQTMGQMSGSSQYLPVKERDPKSIKLENDVAQKMTQAVVQALPKNIPVAPPQSLKTVSFEDAIRELAEFEKNNKPT
jgi:hypothetical protein